MKKYQDWAKREYSIQQRLVALVPAGILFLLILPFLLIVASNAIDAWLRLPRFMMGAINIIAALIFIVAGCSLDFGQSRLK